MFKHLEPTQNNTPRFNKLVNNNLNLLSTGIESFQYGKESFSDEIPSPDNAVISYDPDTKAPYCPFVLTHIDENGGRHYKSYINSSIIDLDKYLDLTEGLTALREIDTLEIYISSPGGLIVTGSAISALIQECCGKVITIATGICASAGSLIWSAGHINKVWPTAVLMWHMSSHTDGGNSKKIETEAKRMVQHVKNVFLSVSYNKGHITKEELEAICNEPNKEFYISAQEMQKRLNAFALKQNGSEE